jgi:hypothetical protein
MNGHSLLSTVSLLAVATVGPAVADEASVNAKPLSELLRPIEQRADFQAFEH